jgi:hypothetical protein
MKPQRRASCPFSVQRTPALLRIRRDGQSFSGGVGGRVVLALVLTSTTPPCLLLDQPSWGAGAGAFAFDIHAAAGDANVVTNVLSKEPNPCIRRETLSCTHCHLPLISSSECHLPLLLHLYL